MFEDTRTLKQNTLNKCVFFKTQNTRMTHDDRQASTCGAARHRNATQRTASGVNACLFHDLLSPPELMLHSIHLVNW